MAAAVASAVAAAAAAASVKGYPQGDIGLNDEGRSSSNGFGCFSLLFRRKPRS